MTTHRILAGAAILSCLLTPSTFASTPTPNAVKYKDSSLPNGKGSSGRATVEARALLGADRMTDIELTTGSFEHSVEPTGSIEKLQIKMPDATLNYNALSSPTHVQRMEGLARHDKLQLHVNVKSGDTTVIQVEETVKLRPNLTASDFAGPATAMAGAPVTITALIRETNGDVGARAACVLFANGQEIDRANNIWVDAGGTVSCRFAHAFDTPSTYDVRVRVSDSNPGDYSTSDNEARGSITVTPPTQDFDAWTWAAKDYTWRAKYIQEGSMFYGFSTPQGWNQSSDFYALISNRTVNFATVRATAVEHTDGELLSDAQFPPLSYNRFCGSSWAELGRLLQVCNVTSTGGAPFVSIALTRVSGDVQYRSHGWEKFYNWETGEYEVYDWADQSTNTYGIQKRMGNTLSLRFNLTDGLTTWEATPSMNLESYTLTNNESRTCWYHPFYEEEVCTEREYYEEGRRGLANYQ